MAVNYSQKISLSDFLDWTLPYISSQLIGEKYKEKLSALIPYLPNLTSPYIAYELPLSEKERWGDLSLLFRPTEQGFPELENAITQHKNTFLYNSQWDRLLQLLAYGNKRGLFHPSCFKMLWLEFDVGSSSLFPSPPNVILAFADQQLALANLEEIFFILIGNKLKSKSLSALHRCLTSDFELKALMFTIARPSQVLKFRLNGPTVLSLTVLSNYLNRIGFAESEELLHLYEIYAPFLIDTDLYLGIDENLLPCVDLCCRIPFNEGEDKPSLLNELTKRNMIDIATFEALLSYQGGQLEPTANARMSGCLSDIPPEHYIFRKIFQVKIRFIPGRSVKLKAYLWSHELKQEVELWNSKTTKKRDNCSQKLSLDAGPTLHSKKNY